jgi:fatty-acyl-CoA synthase
LYNGLIQTISDVEAFERVPLEKRVEAWTVPEVVARGASFNPDAVALYYLLDASPDETPVVITYRELMYRVRQTANLLRRLYGGRDGVVGVLLPLMPENFFLVVGGPAAGILAPVNWAMNAAQIAGILNAAKAEVLVSLGPAPGFNFWETALEVLKLAPGIKHVLQVRGPRGTVEPDKDFSSLIAREPGERFAFERDLKPEDTAVYCPTGGTTGAPKLAKLAHRGIAYKCHAFPWFLGYGPGDVYLGGPSLFHSGGIVYGALTTLSRGVTDLIVSPHGFRAPKSRENFWRLVERYRVTEIATPPTMMAALISLPKPDADLSSLKKYANTGSTGLPAATSRAFEDKFGVRVLGNYGLTENTTSAALSPRGGTPRYGASGIRIPYTQMKIVAVNRDGRYLSDAQPGEVGVIALKGPGVISGYVDQSLDRSLFFPEGWLNTGDLGRIDPDGYIWVTGRSKDLIIRGGNNIDPRIIDETLLAHPAVELSAAVARPDAYAGELPVAYVQLKPGALAKAEEIKLFARSHIPERGAAPAEVYVVDAMPLTGVGKIFKPPLRCDAARRAFADALASLPGGVSASVEVVDDPARGMQARITLRSAESRRSAEAEAKARQVMDAYTMSYEVVWQA